jgi:hypothetical protein
MFTKRFGSLRAAAVLLPSLLVVACDMRRGDGGDDGDGTPQGTAQVRVAHVAPAAPNVDIFVDEATAPAVIDLAFGEGTDYLQLPSGNHSIDVSATGTPADASVINVPSLELAPDGTYTIAAFGPMENLEALVIEEEREDDVPATGVRVRAIHVAPDVGTVDLVSVAEGVAPTPLTMNLAYGDFSEILEVDAAEFTLGIDADDDATPDLLFDIPALPAGTSANVFAVSEAAGQVYLLVQTGPGELLRIDPSTATPPTGPTEPEPTDPMTP